MCIYVWIPIETKVVGIDFETNSREKGKEKLQIFIRKYTQAAQQHSTAQHTIQRNIHFRHSTKFQLNTRQILVIGVPMSFSLSYSRFLFLNVFVSIHQVVQWPKQKSTIKSNTSSKGPATYTFTMKWNEFGQNMRNIEIKWNILGIFTEILLHPPIANVPSSIFYTFLVYFMKILHGLHMSVYDRNESGSYTKNHIRSIRWNIELLIRKTWEINEIFEISVFVDIEIVRISIWDFKRK